MSKYTTELRFICEQAAGLSQSKGFNDIENIISLAIPKIFNFNFPIFDENYRDILCSKILKHYYTREICEETLGLWKLRLSARLNEIMPYYNKLYESELIKFNPLDDTNLTTQSNNTQEIKNEQNEGNSQNQTTTDDFTLTHETAGEGTNRELYSDTPQGSLENIENETYLTSARKNIANTHDNGEDTNKGTRTINSEFGGIKKQEGTTTDEYVQTIKGKSSGASFAKILEEYRESFLNIDLEIINNLSDLFINLW